jgi:hypothetical protein
VFGRFDLSKLPASKRAQALRLQLPGWSPFVDADHAAIWSADGHASVWCWDRASLAVGLSAFGAGVKPSRFVPEPALRAPPVANGLRLIECLDGYEAQHWQDTQLLASRWWPQRPEAGAQLAFPPMHSCLICRRSKCRWPPVLGPC